MSGVASRLAALLLALLLLAVTRPAAAATRLAVFIVSDDAQTSNDLTEVAIARLAEKPGYELLGLHELEASLNEHATGKDGGLRACLTNAACVSGVVASVGVERAVVGDIRREAERYRIELELVDAKAGTTKLRLSRDSSLDLTELIRAVQVGVFDLVRDDETERTATTSAPAAVLPTAPRPIARDARTDRSSERKSAGKSIAPYVGYGSAALAVIAFSAAAVSGTIGSARPTGNTRQEIQNDLERRENYARAANGLLVAGGVLSGVAVVSFAVSWD